MELNEQLEAGQSERVEKDRRETSKRQESHAEETEGEMRAVAAEDIRQGARAKTTGHNIEGNISDLGEKHCGPKQNTDSGLYEAQIRGREISQRFLLSVSAVPGSDPSLGLITGIAALLVAAVVCPVVIYYRHKISELKKQVGPTEEKKVSAADGESVALKTKTDLQNDDKIQWWYQDDSRAAGIYGCIVRTSAGEHLRSAADVEATSCRLANASLSDVVPMEFCKSGRRRPNVCVLLGMNVYEGKSNSTGQHVNESTTVEMSLLNEEDMDGVNE
ncbi:hypothetical protein QQF64_019582 [Cirrhinus molitorella]|uniref:Uncharacterized protein n=1 Tax=Cirrhinus molitorella TaxID=172907 RepID=A0ABR3LIC1_9TELE